MPGVCASMESTTCEQNGTDSLDSNTGDLIETDFVMFKTPGWTDDEITFTFEGEDNLYVSRGFLIQTSPVFRAMLTKDRFKEAEEMKVEITDCSREIMFEFLSCCDPGKLKPVDGMPLFTCFELHKLLSLSLSVKFGYHWYLKT